MPSPVAHSMIGLALGAAWLMPRTSWRALPERARALRGPLAASMFVANAPDLDYVPGILTGELNAFHHGLTHTVPFVMLMAALMACCMRMPFRRAFAWFVAIGASHLAADMVTEDLRAPYGIPALWPFSSEHWIAPVHIFSHLRKRDWSDVLQWHNLFAVAWEFLLTAPLLLAVAWWKTRASGRRAESG